MALLFPFPAGAADTVEGGVVYKASNSSSGAGHVYGAPQRVDQGDLRFVDIGITAQTGEKDVITGVTKDGKAYATVDVSSGWTQLCTNLTIKGTADNVRNVYMDPSLYLITSQGVLVSTSRYGGTCQSNFTMLDTDGNPIQLKDAYITDNAGGGEEGIFGVTTTGSIYRYVVDTKDHSKHEWTRATSITQPIVSISATGIGATPGQYQIFAIGEDGKQYISPGATDYNVTATAADGTVINVAQSRYPSYLPSNYLGTSSGQGAILDTNGTVWQWYKDPYYPAWHQYDPGFTVKKTALGVRRSYDGTDLYMLTAGPIKDATPPTTTIACAPQTGDPAASIWRATSLIGTIACVGLALMAARMRRQVR